VVPGHDFVARPAHELEPVGAELLLALLGGDLLREGEHGVTDGDLAVDDRTRADDHLAPAYLEVAGQGPEADPGLLDPGRVTPQHVGGRTPVKTGRPVGRIHAGRLSDDLRRHPSDLRHPLRRVPCGPRAQFVEPDSPFLDEGPVVEAFLDNDVDPAHEECRVGARPQLDPDIGKPACFGPSGIDDDKLEVARVHPLLEPLEIERRRGAEVAAFDHHALQAGELRALVRHAEQRVVHGDGVAATDSAGAADVRRIAEQVEEARAHRVHVTAVGTLVDRQGLGPVFVLQVGQLHRYLVKRLVPGDLLPPVLAPLPLPLQRMQELLGAVEPLDVMGHPVGTAVVRGRVVLVAAEAGQSALLHRGDQPALVDAARRGPADDLLLVDCAFCRFLRHPCRPLRRGTSGRSTRATVQWSASIVHEAEVAEVVPYLRHFSAPPGPSGLDHGLQRLRLGVVDHRTAHEHEPAFGSAFVKQSGHVLLNFLRRTDRE